MVNQERLFLRTARIYIIFGELSEIRHGASNLTFWKNEDFSKEYQHEKYNDGPTLFFKDNRLYLGYVNNGENGFELGVFTGNGWDGAVEGYGLIPCLEGVVLNSGIEYYPRPQLVVPKLAAHFILFFCEVGVEAAYNTQFKGSYLWSLKPKIGVTFFGCYTLSYNYNAYQKQLTNPIYALMNHHGLSLIIRSQKKDSGFFRIF